MKKAKTPSRSTSSIRFGDVDGDRTRFRYQSLWLDYQDLNKETEAKREQLMKAKQRKLKLEAEVKFLRRRFESLSNNPSQITQHRMKKKHLHKEDNLFMRDANRISGSGIVIRDRDVEAAPRASVIDLNKACVPVGDEMDDFMATREPIRVEKMKSYYIEGDQAMATDVRSSVCRDAKGKRKITWQDQVALRV